MTHDMLLIERAKYIVNSTSDIDDDDDYDDASIISLLISIHFFDICFVIQSVCGSRCPQFLTRFLVESFLSYPTLFIIGFHLMLRILRCSCL